MVGIETDLIPFDNILASANIYSCFRYIFRLRNEVRAKLFLCLSLKPKNVTEMIQTCGLEQSEVSQHLTKLKSAAQKHLLSGSYRIKRKNFSYEKRISAGE